MRCIVCHSEKGVRHFELRIDGESLRLQPDFCDAHGDIYLLLIGRVLGQMLSEKDIV